MHLSKDNATIQRAIWLVDNDKVSYHKETKSYQIVDEKNALFV